MLRLSPDETKIRGSRPTKAEAARLRIRRAVESLVSSGKRVSVASIAQAARAARSTVLKNQDLWEHLALGELEDARNAIRLAVESLIKERNKVTATAIIKRTGLTRDVVLGSSDIWKPFAPDVKSTIQMAIDELHRQRSPITRRAIAELAGCNMRTVSEYKDLWMQYSPYKSEPVRELVDDQSALGARIRNLKKWDLTLLSDPDLQSIAGATRFFSGLAQEPADIQLLQQLVRAVQTEIRARKNAE